MLVGVLLTFTAGFQVRPPSGEVESAMRDFIRNVLERDARSLAFLDEIRTPEAAERHERHDRAVAARDAAERESAAERDWLVDGAGDWPGRSAGLSPREAEILALITQGLTNQDIADRVYLSINSVKTYIRSAYRKIDVERRPQAVLWGIANGFRPDSLRTTDPALLIRRPSTAAPTARP